MGHNLTILMPEHARYDDDRNPFYQFRHAGYNHIVHIFDQCNNYIYIYMCTHLLCNLFDNISLMYSKFVWPVFIVPVWPLVSEPGPSFLAVLGHFLTHSHGIPEMAPLNHMVCSITYLTIFVISDLQENLYKQQIETTGRLRQPTSRGLWGLKCRCSPDCIYYSLLQNIPIKYIPYSTFSRGGE